MMLALFGKNPLTGEVKTRLGKVIGMEKARKLYVAFLKDLVAQHQNQGYSFSFFVPSPETFDTKEISSQPFVVEPQLGKGLGERMYDAFSKLLKEHDKVIIIGGDMPHLSSLQVHKAFEILDKAEVVLGPSEDGGYYLIGMKQAHHELFSNMTWSTDRVLKETIQRANVLNLNYTLLPWLNDVDTAKDLPKDW